MVHQILVLSCKAIGNYLRQEKQTVIADFNLSTNEVLVFENDSIEFVLKTKLRDL
jgi:hypothetical protein